MEEEKITLDMKSFKALASETRVSILKSLKRRRKMLTELSKELRMSPSTVKEHLESLSGAGLVVQVDDGHKWKYYELTRDGREILNPNETRIWVLLGLSGLALIVTGWDLMRTTLAPVWTAKDAFRGIGGEEMLTETAADALPQVAPGAANTLIAAGQIPYIHIMAIGVFAAIFGIALGYTLAKRKWIRPL